LSSSTLSLFLSPNSPVPAFQLPRALVSELPPRTVPASAESAGSFLRPKQFPPSCFSPQSATISLASPSTIRRRLSPPLPAAPPGNYPPPLQSARDKSYPPGSPAPSIELPIPYRSSSATTPRSPCPIVRPVPSTASPAATIRKPSLAPFHPLPSSQFGAAYSPSNRFSPPPVHRAHLPQSDPVLATLVFPDPCA